MASAAPGSVLSEAAPPLPDVGEPAGGGGAQVKVESGIELHDGRQAAESPAAAGGGCGRRAAGQAAAGGRR